MKQHIASHLIVAVFTVFSALHTSAAVLTFEELQYPDNPYFEYGYDGLYDVTEGIYGPALQNHYGGVVWDFGWHVGNNAFVASSQDASDFWCSGPGTQPFAEAQSGHTVLFNGSGSDGLGLSTTHILTGVWLARPTIADVPSGAVAVTVTALAGTSAVASVTKELSGTEPVFMDTSRFLFHAGITRYVVNRERDPSDPRLECRDAEFFIADDFQFASASLAGVCVCDGSRRGHLEYVRCLHRAVVALVREGALTRRQAVRLLRHAVKSHCGHMHHRAR